MSLGPEDYMEPRCLLCDEPYGSEPAVRPVPQQRIIQKMDDFMSRRDYEGALRHLKYWLEEAKAGRDARGELMIRGELVGHCRKMGRREEAFENIHRCLQLLEELGFEGTVSAGTAFVNCATACSAFGEEERAMELFVRAEEAYKAAGGARDELLGGLYNNMALSCAALKRFDQSDIYYRKALEYMGKVSGGELEQAITYLNMADAAAAKDGMEEAEKTIEVYLDRAWELLTGPDVTMDGYYAFVCEKCAPSFSWYGYFLAARELERRAKEIYERNRNS